MAIIDNINIEDNNTYLIIPNKSYDINSTTVTAKNYYLKNGNELQKNMLYPQTIYAEAKGTNIFLCIQTTVLSKTKGKLSLNFSTFLDILQATTNGGYIGATGYFMPNTTVGITPISRIRAYKSSSYIRIYYNSALSSSETYTNAYSTTISSTSVTWTFYSNNVTSPAEV